MSFAHVVRLAFHSWFWFHCGMVQTIWYGFHAQKNLVPIITANAFFCTLSIVMMFSFVRLQLQTTAANSRILLTYFTYMSINDFVLAPICFSLFDIQSLSLRCFWYSDATLGDWVWYLLGVSFLWPLLTQLQNFSVQGWSNFDNLC